MKKTLSFLATSALLSALLIPVGFAEETMTTLEEPVIHEPAPMPANVPGSTVYTAPCAYGASKSAQRGCRKMRTYNRPNLKKMRKSRTERFQQLRSSAGETKRDRMTNIEKIRAEKEVKMQELQNLDGNNRGSFLIKRKEEADVTRDNSLRENKAAARTEYLSARKKLRLEYKDARTDVRNTFFERQKRFGPYKRASNRENSRKSRLYIRTTQ